MTHNTGNELGSAIAKTLHAAAIRNETGIAWVRVLLLTVFVGLEVIWYFTSNTVGLLARVPTVVALVLAIVVLAVLRTGWHRPWIGFVTSALDLALIFYREVTTIVVQTPQAVQEMHEFGNIVGLTALIATTGALRMTQVHAIWTTTLATATIFALGYIADLSETIYGPWIVAVSAIGLLSILLQNQVRSGVEREVTEQQLSRFHPRSATANFSDLSLPSLVRPQLVQATVLVTQMDNFSLWSKDREAGTVFAWLNLMQQGMVDVVPRHGGVVHSFQGTKMTAVFGALEPQSNHIDKTLAAARDLLDETASPGTLVVRLGIHTGPVLVGSLGTGLRQEMTAVGKAVDIAQALQQTAIEQGVQALVSDQTVRSAAILDRIENVGLIPLRGGMPAMACSAIKASR